MLIAMCLSQSLKLKSSWHFVKWITLNAVSMTHHIHNILRFFTVLQLFFYIYSLKRETKWRRFWIRRIQFKWFLLKLKSIIMFLTQSLFFHFFNGHIGNVVSTWLNVVQIDIENNNVVSTLHNVVQINFEIDIVDSTLFNVVNPNVNVRNVASALIWRCKTSRRDINLKPMSKQRWNVCWAGSWAKSRK